MTSRSKFDSLDEFHRRKAQRLPPRYDPVEGPYSKNERTNVVIGLIIFVGIIVLLLRHFL